MNTANCSRKPTIHTPITTPVIKVSVEVLNKIVVTTAGAITSRHHSADNTATVCHIIRVTEVFESGIRRS